VLGGRNRGAHALIRDGAGVVEEARDVIALLQADWHQEFAPPAATASAAGSCAGSEVGSDPVAPTPARVSPGVGADPILRGMRPAEPYRLEELAAESGLATAELMARLTRLEVAGWVMRVEGGRFVKAGPNVLR